MHHAGGKIPAAWVYFHAARAGLTRKETMYLPFGKVLDQIAVWMIEEKGAKQSMARDVFDI